MAAILASTPCLAGAGLAAARCRCSPLGRFRRLRSWLCGWLGTECAGLVGELSLRHRVGVLEVLSQPAMSPVRDRLSQGV